MAALLSTGADPTVDLINCGGSLIHPQFVLTAAHCVAYASQGFPTETDAPDEIEVIVGRTLLSSTGGARVPVKEIIVHPDYNWAQHNDLALLRLEKPLGFPTVQIASEGSLPEGTPALILGWGATDPDYPVYPDNLHQAGVPLIDTTACAEAYGLIVNPAVMLCAGVLGEDPVDSCYGDSGGPLLVERSGEYSVAGITSFGFECASQRFPGVYTRIAAFRDWIVTMTDPVQRVRQMLFDLPDLIELALQPKPPVPRASASYSDQLKYEAALLDIQLAHKQALEYSGLILAYAGSGEFSVSGTAPLRIERSARRLQQNIQHVLSRRRRGKRRRLRQIQRLISSLLS